MSLLQEALKRKEQDEALHKAQGSNPPPPAQSVPEETKSLSINGPVAGPAQGEIKTDAAPAQDMPARSMPVPQQPPDSVPKTIRRTATGLWIAIAVILIALAVTTGGVFLLRFIPLFKTSIAKQIDHNVKTALSATGNIDLITVRNIPPETQTVSASTQASKPSAAPETQTGSGAQAVPAQTAIPGQTAEVSSQPSAPLVGQKAEATKSSPFKLKWSAPQTEGGKWPALKLTGILRGSATGESTAYINGKMLRAGQTVEGVGVVEIQSDRVLLKYGTETKILRVGGIPY